MATLGQDIPDIEITIPEEIVDRVEIVEVGDAVEVAVTSQVSDLKVTAETGTTTAVVGKQVSDSSFSSKAVKGDSSTVAFETTKVQDTNIVVKGKGDGVVNVNTGRFNGNSIEFKKKSADSVQFNNGVEVRNATIDGGKGADTITFKENTVIKGTNEITLGKGKDVLELPANKSGKGSIVVTDLSKKDTIKIGDESFKGKDILNGNVELPNYIEIQGLD